MKFKYPSGSNVDRNSCTMERYSYTLETHQRDKIVNASSRCISSFSW